MHIAFDLDNTIICYDRAFAQAAIECGYLSSLAGIDTKQQVREVLERRGPNGVRYWQALQGLVYGRGIARAELFPGVLTTLSAVAAAGHTMRIISHKTQFGHFDETRTNLREAARGFLADQGVCAHIRPADILFCDTLASKIAAIADSRCDVFVDDLPDVLLHTAFPPQVRRIVFRSHAGECEQAQSWHDVERLILPAAA